MRDGSEAGVEAGCGGFLEGDEGEAVAAEGAEEGVALEGLDEGGTAEDETGLRAAEEFIAAGADEVGSSGEGFGGGWFVGESGNWAVSVMAPLPRSSARGMWCSRAMAANSAREGSPVKPSM